MSPRSISLLGDFAIAALLLCCALLGLVLFGTPGPKPQIVNKSALRAERMFLQAPSERPIPNH